MQETPSDHVIVSAVMLRQVSQHPWGDHVWSLLGLIPGLSQQELTQAAKQGELHYWSDLSLQLYPLHCESYYHNLMSGKPQAYFVSQQDADQTPSPLLLTVDYDEAASYMETGEQIFNADLPDELCVWLERFVLNHYQPERSKKRRRKQWYDKDPKTK